MKQKLLYLLTILAIATSMFNPSNTEAAVKTYTISPSSKPYKGNMTNFSTYNKYTKHYYVLRSYLEQFEKAGGGTLILKKGTYTITNTLYVPSNVTIKFKDGVKIIKGMKTGTSKVKPAKSIFQLVKPSKSLKNGAYGSYNGEKNISFIGEGNVEIDMKYDRDGIAIIAGHNKNILIDNITFKNMHSGHFIEMDATDGAVIKNSKFMNSKASVNSNKEAINLDTPDRNTQGWSQVWSKFDRTPNKNVNIINNKFYNLDRAIGTHKYSEGKYHENILIENNNIEQTRQDAIRVMNWKDPVIQNNTIVDVDNGKGTFRGILASGAINPTFKNNRFELSARPIQIMPWKNSGPGSQYAVTNNLINEENKTDLATNSGKGLTEYIVRINHTYNVYHMDTDKIEIRIIE